jgi:hypothetical protein
MVVLLPLTAVVVVTAVAAATVTPPPAQPVHLPGGKSTVVSRRGPRDLPVFSFYSLADIVRSPFPLSSTTLWAGFVTTATIFLFYV